MKKKRKNSGAEMKEEKVTQPEEAVVEEVEIGENEELKEENVIATLEKERDDAKDKYLRLIAEFENFRRRNAQERISWIKNANEQLLLKICDVMDDFERALKVDSEKDNSFYKGVESIYSKLEKVIKSEGVTKIEAEDKEFNPMYHEAIAYTPSDEEKDKIIAVIQNGYIMNDKIIRAAKVAVSSGKNEEEK